MELLFVAVRALRLLLALFAIGAPVMAEHALVLNVSGALAPTVGVSPAGLGLQEGIAAALAPTVGLLAAQGFLATAANRVIGLAGNALVAAILLRRADRL